MFNRLMSTKALGEVTVKKQLYVIVLAQKVRGSGHRKEQGMKGEAPENFS